MSLRGDRRADAAIQYLARALTFLSGLPRPEWLAMTEEKSVGRDAPTLVAQLKKSLYFLEVQDSLENADVVEEAIEGRFIMRFVTHH